MESLNRKAPGKSRIGLAGLLSVLALAACTKDDPAGPPDGNTEGVLSGTLHMPGGSPAREAKIRLYSVDHVPGPGPAQEPSHSVRTDSEGRFTVDSLPRGQYNVLGLKDGLVSIADSLYLAPGEHTVLADTLEPAGTVAGRIEIQPNHDARKATVRVLGTDRYAQADAEGRFTLSGLAEGSYQVRVETDLEKYEDLTAALRARSGSVDSLADPLRPKYGGVPMIAGVIRSAGGIPAAGATVRLYPVDHVPRPDALGKISSGAEVYTVRTDGSGRYAVDSLPQGDYNILGEKDGLVSFEDSIFLAPGVGAVTAHTLETAGSATARVEIQPQHDPRTVTVHVLGTSAYTNVDEEGRFTLTGLAAGTYRLRIETAVTGYTTLYSSLRVWSGAADTVSAPFLPAFTLIPVVTGLRATLDTATGVARLAWNPTGYRRLQSYVIYRHRRDAVIPAPMAIGSTTDTVWSDTLYPSGASDYGLSSGSFPPADSWEYRVRILNQSNETGETFGGARLDAVPPSWVQTHLEFRSLGTDNGQASLNDTVKVVALFRNRTRELSKVLWRESGMEHTLRDITLGAGASSGSDTLTVIGGRLGARTFHCQVLMAAGGVSTFPFPLTVVSAPPVVSAGNDVTTRRGETLRLVGSAVTRFGRIVKWEWDIGGKGIFTESPDGVREFEVPDSLTTFPCILRATNEDGESALDTLLVTPTLGWRLVGKAPLPGNQMQMVEFQGRVWLLGLSGPFSTEDGIAWRKEESVEGVTDRVNFGAFVLRDTMCVVGGESVGISGTHSDVTCTGDGVNWNRWADLAPIVGDVIWSARMGGRFWMVGRFAREILSTEDGRNWTRRPTDPDMVKAQETVLMIATDSQMVVGTRPTGEGPLLYWRTRDGLTWYRAQPNLAVDRFAPGWVLYRNRLWSFGAGVSSFHPEVEVYSSAEGVSWRKEAAMIKGLKPKSATLAYKNRIWIIDNDDLIISE